jgi:glycosyltransferase involved in cell wall biosynthesis
MIIPKLVSVIIPVYNGELYLAEALDSVLAQDYRPIEVIVVDDGSTDNTAEVARKYSQVHYLHQTNQGPPAARNTGLSHCKGDLIAFLDADDLWVSGKLSMQVSFLEAHPEAGCVMGRTKNVLQEGVVRPSWVEESTLSEDSVAYHMGTLLAHRRVLETVGNFNASYLYSDDFDWLIRLKESNISIGKMEKILHLRRIHLSNLSHNPEGRVIKTHSRIRLLKETIDRRRKADRFASC